MKEEVFWKNPGYKIRPALEENISCDYLIVGGGVLGVSIAYFLAKNKAKNIVLIEKNYIASGASGKAAGSIVTRGELDLRDIVQHHGRMRGIIFWRSGHEGLRIMKEMVEKEKIKCDFEQQDTLYGGLPGENHKFILEEYALEDEIEPDTKLLSELLSDKEMHQYIKTDLFKYAILSPNHGVSVNPLQYTQNLSHVIEKKGVRVFEKTPFIKIKDSVAITPKAEIKFKNAIIALDADLKNKKIKNRETTIAITKPLSKKQLADIGLTVKRIVWTSKSKYEYLKVTKDNRLLVGFGDVTVSKKHKGTKPNHTHLRRIKEFLKEIFPQLQTEFEYAWSGTFGFTNNYTPIFDFRDNVISVGGAASQLVCTITAKHIADKLMNKSSILDKFFWI